MISKKLDLDKKRHVVKAISYRIYSTCITMMIAAFVTGDCTLAISIGTIDFGIKIFTYYIHERVWIRINFGIKHERKDG